MAKLIGDQIGPPPDATPAEKQEDALILEKAREAIAKSQALLNPPRNPSVNQGGS